MSPWSSSLSRCHSRESWLLWGYHFQFLIKTTDTRHIKEKLSYRRSNHTCIGLRVLWCLLYKSVGWSVLLLRQHYSLHWAKLEKGGSTAAYLCLYNRMSVERSGSPWRVKWLSFEGRGCSVQLFPEVEMTLSHFLFSLSSLSQTHPFLIRDFLLSYSFLTAGKQHCSLEPDF